MTYAAHDSISEMVAKQVKPDEVVWLNAEGREFLGILSRARRPEAKGSILLLPSTGNHANWSHVIQPLREKFSIDGWYALSISLPDMQPNAPLKNAVLIDSQITEAIALLKKNTQNPLILVGYGTGGVSAILYTVKHPQACEGLVIISASLSGSVQDTLEITKSFTTIKLPILDITADLDDPNVIRFNKERRRLGSQIEGFKYRLRTIGGETYDYTNADQLLTKTIRAWIDAKVFEKSKGDN